MSEISLPTDRRTTKIAVACCPTGTSTKAILALGKKNTVRLRYQRPVRPLSLWHRDAQQSAACCIIFRCVLVAVDDFPRLARFFACAVQEREGGEQTVGTFSHKKTYPHLLSTSLEIMSVIGRGHFGILGQFVERNHSSHFARRFSTNKNVAMEKFV